MRIKSALSMIVLIILSTSQVFGGVQLPSIFADHMVLQRNTDVPVWGKAESGESVAVTFQGETVRTTTGRNGRWQVSLKPMPAGGPYILTVQGADTRVFRNVMVGEVWVCSGQSNMAMTVNSSNNAKQEIAAADYPNIRLFQVGRVIAQEPQEDVPATWSECSPETVQDFSAVAYCFGRELYKKLGVPIGLLHTSWGGTGSESWTSADMMAANNAFKPILKKLEDSRAGYDAKYAEFEKNLAEYREKARKMRAAGEDPGREPRAPYGPIHQHAPSRLFNGMVAPLIPYAFQGAIWYQGEHNASRAYQYREIFPAMIQDWRNHWIRGDFPFLFVQLANFRERKTEPVEEDWAELREAQLMTLKMKNTGQAVIIDIGEADNIHPTNKQDVGHRLAVAARAQVYGEKIEYSGPMYEASRIVGKKVYLQFSHQGSGMTTKGDVALKGFAIAGADKKFVWADAEIVGGEIMVSSAMVPKPVAVRYGWANNPECNLYNREGLPASPFRTDTWKGITADNK